jgi:hypothetical protein
MEGAIQRRFLQMNSGERAAWIGRVRQYVQNDQFVNLLSNLDVNDTNPKNRGRPSSIFFVSTQLTAFNGVPGLPKQVSAWIAS